MCWPVSFSICSRLLLRDRSDERSGSAALFFGSPSGPAPAAGAADPLPAESSRSRMFVPSSALPSSAAGRFLAAAATAFAAVPPPNSSSRTRSRLCLM